MAHRSWQELMAEPVAERHIVQLYREPAFLAAAVAAWAAPALRERGGVLLVARPAHRDLILDALRARGLDPTRLQQEGRLEVHDPATLLATVLVDGMPDKARLEGLAAATFGRLRKACGRDDAPLRVWGEGVDVLWQRGDTEASRRLEALWNGVIEAQDVRVLCSYHVDNLSPETHEGTLRAICETHSHLVPEEDDHGFDVALGQALVDVLGEDEAMAVRTRYALRRTIPVAMPPAQAVVVALHEERPDVARRVLAATRAHLARAP